MEVGFVTFPDVEELDLVGPWEVFAHAAHPNGSPAFRLALLGEGPAPGQGGLPFLPSLPLERWRGDVLVIPGGPGARRAAAQAAPWLTALRTVGMRTPWVLSVCTGAFLTAATGLVDPLRHVLTTHRDFVEELRRLHPDLPVVRQRVTVSPGRISTAGVSAGVNGALALVEVLLGRQESDRIARFLEWPLAAEGGTTAERGPARRGEMDPGRKEKGQR